MKNILLLAAVGVVMNAHAEKAVLELALADNSSYKMSSTECQISPYQGTTAGLAHYTTSTGKTTQGCWHIVKHDGNRIIFFTDQTKRFVRLNDADSIELVEK